MWLIGLKLTKNLIIDFYCTIDLNYVLKQYCPEQAVVKNKIYNTVKCAKAERI